MTMTNGTRIKIKKQIRNAWAQPYEPELFGGQSCIFRVAVRLQLALWRRSKAEAFAH